MERDQAESALRDLFAHAAPREQPPAAVVEEIRRAVHAEWDAVTGRRMWFRRVGAVAAAAVVLAAAAVLVVGREPELPGPAVARVERVLGTVDFDAGGHRGPLRVGDEILPGATLATGSGQLALRLTSGGSLRIAPETRVTLSAANGAELAAGALYFDSEHAPARAEPFAIATRQGTLRDVGTQFAARIDDAGLEVGVRDGRVSLTRGTTTTAAAAGEKLTVGRGADVRREPLPTFGSDWAWTERLAPPFDIDGRRLSEVLEWVAAQTGRTLTFADPALERLARETVLSGSIDLEPMQKLVAVLATTGDLDYAIEGGRLLILAR
ncbi:MAG TPA: FecR domain-containing protein [Gammaproteobacteria bacterium]|nr:FecR domain-containing protein [Gammaproteobacteria bacterium]